MLDAIGPGEIAAEAKMIRSRTNAAILLAEGDSDVSFLMRFVDSKNCQLIDARGKPNALGALEILVKQNTNGVLAMVDADFDALLQRSLPKEIVDHVVHPDGNDLELMLFMSPALTDLLREYASKDKLASFKKNSATPRLHILREAAKVGALRYANSLNQLGLCFRKLDLKDVIDKATLTVVASSLVRRVLAHSSCASKSRELEDHVSHELSKTGKRMLRCAGLCNGHDVASLLALGLRTLLGTNDSRVASRRNIEKLLRLAYSDRYFRKSVLFAALQSWQANNSPYRIL